MTNVEMLAQQLCDQLPRVKSGTLRICGEWFGRPYDNIHTIIGANTRDDALVISFDQGETLVIEHPDQAVFDARTFRIGSATRVRWEWFSYGKERSPESLLFLDYAIGSNGWTLNTNSRFPPPPYRHLAGPAAELL
jgi:hypothetical protein